MVNTKEELVKMMNRALELEHAARIQYLAHAEAIRGLGAEKIIERIKEIASDEEKHENKFRGLIAAYLDGAPSMGISKTQPANQIEQILQINLKNEREAIDFYKQIYQKADENKKDLPYVFEMLEHELRHIIIDEEEHVAELSVLLG